MGFLENLFQTTLPGECIGKKAAPKPAPVTPPAPETPEPAPVQPAQPQEPPVQPAVPEAAPAQPVAPQTAPVQPQPPVQPAAPLQPAAPQQPVQQPVTPAQPAAPQAAPAQPASNAGSGESMEKLLGNLITPANFPGYAIYQDVHPGMLDSTAHPKSRQIAYLFRLSGDAKLAVFLMDRSQERSMPTVGTCRILDSRGIPYLIFFRRDRSDAQTVLKTIRGKLGHR